MKTIESLQALKNKFDSDYERQNKELEYWQQQKNQMRLPQQGSKITLAFHGGIHNTSIELTEPNRSYSHSKQKKYGRVLQLMDFIILDEIKQITRKIKSLEDDFKKEALLILEGKS